MYVYGIECHTTGRLYIGKSKHPVKRWREHIHSKRNDYLYRCMKKYGSENFSFWIINKLDNDDQALLLEKELISYLRSMNVPLMNVHPGGRGGRVRGWKHTNASKKKMSIASSKHRHSLETKRKMSESHRGRKKSLETRKRMSIAQKNQPRSFVEKRSQNLRGKKRPELSADKNPISISKEVALAILKEDKSISSKIVAKKYNVDYATVRRIRKGIHWICRC